MIWKNGRVIRAEIDFEGNGTFYDVSNYIKRFNVDRFLGINNKDAVDEAEIVLNSKKGIFDPFNFQDAFDPASEKFNGPAQADGYGNLRPGREIKIYCDLVNTESGDLTSQIFYGIIENFEYDKEAQLSTIKIRDRGAKLFQPLDEDIVLVNYYVSRAVSQGDDIVNTIGVWAGISINTIDYLVKIPVFEVKAGETLWSALRRLAEAVGGFIHVSGDGSLYFRSYDTDVADYDYLPDYALYSDMLLETPEISYTKPVRKIVVRGRYFDTLSFDVKLFELTDVIKFSSAGETLPEGIREEKTKNIESYVLEYEADHIINVFLDRVPTTIGTKDGVSAYGCAVLGEDKKTVTFTPEYQAYEWWPNVVKRIQYKMANPSLQYYEVKFNCDYADLTRVYMEVQDQNGNIIATYDMDIDTFKTQEFINYFQNLGWGLRLRFRDIWIDGSSVTYAYITKLQFYGYPVYKRDSFRLSKYNPYTGSGETFEVDNEFITNNPQAQLVLDYYAWKFKPAKVLKVKTWMIPWVQPGNLIEVALSDNTLDGLYQVIEVHHSGTGGYQPITELLLQTFETPSITKGPESLLQEFKSYERLAEKEDYNSLGTLTVGTINDIPGASIEVSFSNTSLETLGLVVYDSQNDVYNLTDSFKKAVEDGLIYYQILSGVNVGETGKIIGYTDGAKDSTVLVLEGAGAESMGLIELLEYAVGGSSVVGNISIDKAEVVDSEGDVVLGKNQILSTWNYSYVKEVKEPDSFDLWVDNAVKFYKVVLKVMKNTATVDYNGNTITNTYVELSPSALYSVNITPATITDNFTGDGATTTFVLTKEIGKIISVKINDVETTAYSIDRDNRKIIFDVAPETDATIEVSYYEVDNVKVFATIYGIFNYVS